MKSNLCEKPLYILISFFSGCCKFYFVARQCFRFSTSAKQTKYREGVRICVGRFAAVVVNKIVSFCHIFPLFPCFRRLQEFLLSTSFPKSKSTKKKSTFLIYIRNNDVLSTGKARKSEEQRILISQAFQPEIRQQGQPSYPTYMAEILGFRSPKCA